MRIAILNDWWIPDLVGGAERSALENFKLLSTEDHEICIFIPRSVLKFSFSQNLHVASVPILSFRRQPRALGVIKMIEKVRVFFDLLSPLLIAQRIRRFNPDVLLVHQIDRLGPFFMHFCKFLNPDVKIVRVYHDLGDICVLRTRFRNDRNCRKLCNLCKPKNALNRWSSKLIDFAIYNSNFTKNQFNELNYRPVTGCVGYPFEKPTTRNQKIKNKIHSGYYEIGYVGRLHPTKGLEFLIRSASKIQGVRVNFVGTGDDKYIKQLADLARRLDLPIFFHGFQEFPFHVLKGMGVLVVVVPSKWDEPFGRIPLEAASFGIRSLVADTGGLAESVTLINPEVPTFVYGDEHRLVSLLKIVINESINPSEINIKPYKTINSRLIEYLGSISH